MPLTSSIRRTRVYALPFPFSLFPFPTEPLRFPRSHFPTEPLGIWVMGDRVMGEGCRVMEMEDGGWSKDEEEGMGRRRKSPKGSKKMV